MRTRMMVLVLAAFAIGSAARAEITRHGGSDEALPDQKYIHVVSETDSPVMQTWIKAKDGVYVAAAVRKPKGEGPFPAIVMFHGAPGGRGMDQLVGWSRGDHGGPVWERFLQEGYVVVVADYRGGPGEVNTPSSNGMVTAIDDGITVVDYVQNLPYVQRAQCERLRREPRWQPRHVPRVASADAACRGGWRARAYLVPGLQVRRQLGAARLRKGAAGCGDCQTEHHSDQDAGVDYRRHRGPVRAARHPPAR